jgi:hypothetical protein
MFSEEPFGANDPYARQMDIFPRLAPEMMARIGLYGSRSGSVMRVASAVGEGSVVVAAIHEYIASAGID